MALFQIRGDELQHVREKNIDLEKHIQKLVEKNLSAVFDLEFVASEFAVKDFRVDTLAFSRTSNSFVIIEYKRDKSISIIDQGFAYLELLLENKAEFVLKYNETKKSSVSKDEINWESSKVIFVANSFTKHQERASSFEDLPIELWEVELYENNLLHFNKIENKTAGVSLKSLSRDKTVQKIAREVKTYSLDDLFKSNWSESRELFNQLSDEITALEDGVSESITKFYVAFMPKSSARSFVEIVPQKQGLKVYLRPKVNALKNSTSLKLEDCSVKGHWTNGNSYFTISRKDEIRDALQLIRSAFESEH